MELHELGKQYMQRAEILSGRIKELNAYLKKVDSGDKFKLKHRISSLYADAAECRRLAEILMNYRRENTK